MVGRTLDFHFGWRWLLPAVGDASARLYGFSSEEEQFLKGALPGLTWVSDERPAVVLVDGVGCAGYSEPPSAAIENARVVCVIASRAHGRTWRTRLSAAFPHLREYGLLPESSPRVVVPLGSSKHAITGLSLHRPGRLVARLALRVARALATVGSYYLLRGRVLLIASREGNLSPRAAVEAGRVQGSGPDVDFALYLGTPDDNRKTVILPLGASAPDVILKAAATHKACAALTNEAVALSALADSSLAPQVPKLAGKIAANGGLTLYQEYRPRRATGRLNMNRAVTAFLAGLSRLNAAEQSLADRLSALPEAPSTGLTETATAAFYALRARLQSYAEAGTVLWLHRNHGDFAPWNCAWTDSGLFVFDWEASRPQDLAFGDAFYYAIAPALLVQRNANAQQILDGAVQLAQQVADAAGMAEIDCRLYLALWLLGRETPGRLHGELMVALDRSWS